MVVLNLTKQIYMQYDPGASPSKYVTVVSGLELDWPASPPGFEPGQKGSAGGLVVVPRDFLLSV